MTVKSRRGGAGGTVGGRPASEGIGIPSHTATTLLCCALEGVSPRARFAEARASCLPKHKQQSSYNFIFSRASPRGTPSFFPPKFEHSRGSSPPCATIAIPPTFYHFLGTAFGTASNEARAQSAQNLVQVPTSWKSTAAAAPTTTTTTTTLAARAAAATTTTPPNDT